MKDEAVYAQYRRMLASSRHLLAKGRSVCETLCDWIREGRYKKHWDEDKQCYYQCSSFKEFMESSAPKGLGLDLEQTKEELDILRRGGIHEAEVVLAEWMKGEHLPVKKIGVEGGTPGPGRGHKTDNNIIRFNRQGTDTDYTIRRLARDAPEFLDRIQSGELSVNAAAIAAGIRKKPSQSEICVKAFRKAENRLEALRFIFQSLEPHERVVLADWMASE